MDIETQTQGEDVAPVITDTAATPTSEADVQVIETPQAAEAQEATVNATDTVDEKLYAGKYKSIEDLEKSYTELQSKYGQTTSEKAELSRILADAFAAEPTVQQPAPTYDEYDEPAPTNNSNDVVTRDLSVLKFVVSNPDADGAAMMEVLKSDPLVANINGYDAKLKYAYAISQNTSKPKAVAEAVAQAQVQTQAKFVEKQAAQVESASKQSPPTEEEPLTRAQIQSALRDDKSFADLLKKRQGFSNYIS
jgi:hypothetical protein